ncbi:d226694e-d6ed-45dc-bf00-493dd995285c [Sclerotinia trifoliorum]|uniref:D226694e-d6ed-45dc-bf00-493dd995285c n=1 Tax=Sclerotinia trifoliorum TaxID=28548 RepID=A0A8H2ZLC1_9HELO|nr:d226694e-d6ed-45dc-bf00-493dd995285c [Sclerotinia trifoliorum]
MKAEVESMHHYTEKTVSVKILTGGNRTRRNPAAELVLSGGYKVDGVDLAKTLSPSKLLEKRGLYTTFFQMSGWQ